MTPALIPQPQRYRPLSGSCPLPLPGPVGIPDSSFHGLGGRAADLLGVREVTIARRGDSVVLKLVKGLAADRYRLAIHPEHILIEGGSATALKHAIDTLAQLVDQAVNQRLHCCRIEDWPDFGVRGVYYDVTRGRVPLREQLVQQANQLAAFKINHLQYYVEHTFRFRGHPLIGRGASPLSAGDMLAMDEHCDARGIELVPSLASFGHLAPVLKLKPYRRLAEDWGVERYLDPEAAKLPKWKQRRAWSLAPANPDTYRFLDSLYSEFLPLFRSRQFNACCDETWDLGMGQSYALCRRRGKGRMYLDHLLHLRRLSRRYGKSLMFWGDIIHHYPELIPDIPRDVTVLDWGYDHATPFNKVRAFEKAKVPFHVCPGTSSWVSLFPRLHEATASIHGYAAAGRQHGAAGLINTDWGDQGHFNFMEFSWHGYLYGAEQAWNGRADRSNFTERFSRVFLRNDARDLPRAITALGDVAHTNVAGYYQGVWYHIFFAQPDHVLFKGGKYDAWVSHSGKIAATKLKVDAQLGRRTLEKLEEIRAALVSASRVTGSDPQDVLPYWIFAVDTIAHAARKLSVLAPGGRDTAAARAGLRREMRQIRERFQSLWLARNRPSEIRTTLRRYRTAADALR